MWQGTKNLYHLLIALLARVYYRFPGRKLTVIGVTGTDGKTTTTSLMYHMLKSSGRNTSLISTVAAYIGNNVYDTGFHVTNPSPIQLQRFIRAVAKLGLGNEKQYLILEVTSHGIDQNRIWGIPFAIGVLTNITHEHLDYHKTYDNYFLTKAKLLKRAKKVVLNRDDDTYPRMSQLLKDKPVITYGVSSQADVTPKTIEYTSQMPGFFEQYNELAAIAVCKELGLSDKEILSGLTSFVLPEGRLQMVYSKDFEVMIDFAHTPNAFLNILSYLRPKVNQTHGRIIHVFGCPSKRDVSKRSLMGRNSAQFADVVVLTSEDPRGESVEEINKQIQSGITDEDKKRITLVEIQDRAKAIEYAIGIAKKNDLVLLTGKAHEKSMNYGHGEIPWSEFSAVEQALKKEGLV